MNRWLLGLLIILAGVIGILNNFNIIDVSFGALIHDYWPVILIILGLSLIIKSRSYLAGIILTGLGAVFIGHNLNLFTVDISQFWGMFWPLIIIIVGLKILFGNRTEESGTAFMSGLDKKNGFWKLESGSYQAIMGGIDLDLRQAEIGEGITKLELTAFMGGIDIVVPADLAVSCQGSAFLGGLEMLGKESGGLITNLKAEQGDIANAARLVVINCTAIMGGITIK